MGTRGDMDTKRCIKCGADKALKSFNAGRNVCTSCRNKQAALRSAAKVAANPDEYRLCSGCQVAHTLDKFDGDSKICRKKLASGARNDAKPERRQYHLDLNKEKKYYTAWRAKKRAQDPVEYLSHLAKLQREYYSKNSDVILAQQKTRPRTQLCNCKAKARERDLDWALTDEEALKMIDSPCFYSGVYLPDEHTTGIDRLDSGKGYVIGNVVPCNGVVNMMKNILGVLEFVDTCTKFSDGEIDIEDDRVRVMFSRHDNCVKRNMHVPLSFEDMCAAVASNFDADKLASVVSDLAE